MGEVVEEAGGVGGDQAEPVLRWLAGTTGERVGRERVGGEAVGRARVGGETIGRAWGGCGRGTGGGGQAVGGGPQGAGQPVTR
ncbi:hypothetical protein [Micromonospora sp. WMMD998]|uniref:hypothetical protein n=1 Tax=Micromonospora sp. WMMD998 TaxID=3016092 RepID=UPI00249A8A2C|nr:hypothetical protein [Micromonospora sp. WMMD998]WFE40640.1 hypothetical protein O7619_20175 [Micromonospora sp. WMMD998]